MRGPVGLHKLGRDVHRLMLKKCPTAKFAGGIVGTEDVGQTIDLGPRCALGPRGSQRIKTRFQQSSEHVLVPIDWAGLHRRGKAVGRGGKETVSMADR